MPIFLILYQLDYVITLLSRDAFACVSDCLYNVHSIVFVVFCDRIFALDPFFFVVLVFSSNLLVSLRLGSVAGG